MEDEGCLLFPVVGTVLVAVSVRSGGSLFYTVYALAFLSR